MARKKAAAKNLIPDDAIAVLDKLAKKTKGKFLSHISEGKITINIRVAHYDDGTKEHLIPDEGIPILKKLGKKRGL